MTLRRERKKIAHQFLADRGYTVVSHTRSKTELEILFQLLLNRYAQVTNQKHEDVFNQISVLYCNVKKRGLRSRAQIIPDSNWERGSDRCGGSLLSSETVINSKVLNAPDLPEDYEHRSEEPIEPNVPKHKEQD